MSQIPKKLLALAAPLAIVVGLVAPSMASAGVASEALPTTNSENWTAVTTKCNGVSTPVAGCKFVATSTASVLTNFGTAFTTCEVVLEGLIFGDGSTKITGGKVVTETTLCKRIKLKEFPWADQICEDKASTPHSYYDRISINFFEAAGEQIKGPIYVHLLNEKKEDAKEEEPLTVKFASAQKFGSPTASAEIGKGPWGILANGSSGSTMYAFGAEPVIEVISKKTEACPWKFEKLNELP